MRSSSPRLRRSTAPALTQERRSLLRYNDRGRWKRSHWTSAYCVSLLLSRQKLLALLVIYDCWLTSWYGLWCFMHLLCHSLNLSRVLDGAVFDDVLFWMCARSANDIVSCERKMLWLFISLFVLPKVDCVPLTSSVLCVTIAGSPIVLGAGLPW